jgi:hypothetical protein
MTTALRKVTKKSAGVSRSEFQQSIKALADGQAALMKAVIGGVATLTPTVAKTPTQITVAADTAATVVAKAADTAMTDAAAQVADAAKKALTAADDAAGKVAKAVDEAIQKIKNAATSAALNDSAAKSAIPIEKMIEDTIVATFERLGIDTSDPIQTRADFQAIRDWRETMRYVRRRGIGAFVWTLVVGVLTAVGLGISAYMKTMPG